MSYISKPVVVSDEVGVFDGGLAREVHLFDVFVEEGELVFFVGEKLWKIGPSIDRNKLSVLLQEVDLRIVDGLLGRGRVIARAVQRSFPGVEEHADLVIYDYPELGFL